MWLQIIRPGIKLHNNHAVEISIYYQCFVLTVSFLVLLQAVLKGVDLFRSTAQLIKRSVCSHTSACTSSRVRVLCLYSFFLHATATPHPSGWEVPAWEAQLAQSSSAWRKPRIFIEDAASLFLLSKTKYRTTPHEGGDAGTGSSINEWKKIGDRHRDHEQARYCLLNFRIFLFDSPVFSYEYLMLKTSTSEFN